MIALPKRRYCVDVVYGRGFGEEFMEWTDDEGRVHDEIVMDITTGVTYVQFEGENDRFGLWADSEGARVTTATSELSAQRELQWEYERREDVCFGLVSNWLEPVEIPTRDPANWGVDYRGFGLWGKSSVGRAAYLCTDDAFFGEHDLIDIVGATNSEWQAGLGPLGSDVSYWKTSIILSQGGVHLVPRKHAGEAEATPLIPDQVDDSHASN